LVHALEIRLAPGRAAHGFAFAPVDNPGAMTGGGQGVLVTGTAGAEGWLQIDFGWNPNQPFLLLDTNSSEWLSLNPEGAQTLDARTAFFSMPERHPVAVLPGAKLPRFASARALAGIELLQRIADQFHTFPSGR
jgi:hypothetical protein